jgi:hypothetical protein
MEEKRPRDYPEISLPKQKDCSLKIEKGKVEKARKPYFEEAKY